MLGFSQRERYMRLIRDRNEIGFELVQSLEGVRLKPFEISIQDLCDTFKSFVNPCGHRIHNRLHS